MKISTCKLCNELKELQRSHVIGKSVFRNMLKNGEHYAITTSLSENKIFRSNDQWATPMLCSDCEQLLNNKYENYSLWALRNKQRGIKHREGPNCLIISNLNQYRVGMYVLSIFWRASQSKHKAFANVELTDEINRYFQNCIKGLIGLDPNAVMIKVAKLKCSRNYYTEEHLGGIITNPVLRKLGENRFSYFMIFSGYYFEIMLYTTPGLKVSEAGVLKKNKRILKVPYIDILSIPEMVNAFLKTRELQKSQQVF